MEEIHRIGIHKKKLYSWSKNLKYNWLCNGFEKREKIVLYQIYFSDAIKNANYEDLDRKTLLQFKTSSGFV